MRTPSRFHSIAAAIAGALCVLGGAAAVSAQATRAEAIAQQQEAKSRALRPNLPNRAERVLTRIEAHATNPDALSITFGGLYPSAGLAPGLAWRHAFGATHVTARGAWSLRNYKLAQAAVQLPDIGGDRVSVRASVRWLDATQVPFYGLGNETRKEARANYGYRSAEAGATAAYALTGWLSAEGGVALMTAEDREGRGRWPSIETVQPALDGLSSSPTYIRSTAGLAFDTRESPGYTRSGAYYAATLRDFHDRDGASSFRQTDVDLRQFVPLLKEQWVIAVRGLLRTTHVADGEVVPYYLLPSLGGNASVRSYPDLRFQDRHLLLFSGEYRWFPNRALDLAIFADAGQVAARRDDFAIDRLKVGYGLGARFHGPNFTPLRLDVAHGREGIRINLTGHVAF